MGPTIIFRRSWYRLEGYKDDVEFFDGGPEDKWQWKFMWYGGDIEYKYRLDETTDLALSIIPGIPAPIVFSFGANLKVNQ